MTDHAGLGAEVAGRFGPLLGRARQLGIWTLAFVAAMTLPGALAAARARARLARGWRQRRISIAPRAGHEHAHRRRRRARPRRRSTSSRGLALQSFEPLARFALVRRARCCCRWPRTLVPPARAGRFRAAVAAAAVAFSVAVWLVATVGRERIWAGAESMGAVTRLDGEDRELARCLRAHRRPHEPVMIEPLAFAEIGIAHAAGVPWTESVTLIVTREPRATVAESMLATGARFLVGYDSQGNDGGWPRRLPTGLRRRREDRSMANRRARNDGEQGARWVKVDSAVGCAVREPINTGKFTSSLPAIAYRVIQWPPTEARLRFCTCTWRTPGDC